VTISPSGWNFSFDMPGFPEESEPQVSKGKLYMASDGLYGASAGTIAPPMAREDAETYFQQKKLGLERIVGTQVSGRKNFVLQGMPACRVWVNYKKDGVPKKMDFLMVFAGNRFYVLEVDRTIGAKGIDDGKVERFFKSLSIKNAVFGYGL
jgi:hypothetical protein